MPLSLFRAREGLFADMPALQITMLMEEGVGINDSDI